MDEKFASASSSDSGVIISDRIRNDTNSTSTVDGATTINIENVIDFSKTNSNENRTSTEEQKKCKSSDTPSSRSSCSISINSIDDENAIDSSVIDSESEFENDDANGDCIVRKLGPQVTYPPNSNNIPDIGNGLTVVSQIVSDSSGPLPQSSASKAPIGSIAISNATDVTFGDKHFYEGPVTVQQFLIDSRKNWKPFDGLQNPVFENDNGGTDASAGGDDENKQKEQIPEIYKSILNCRAAIVTTIIIALTIAASTLVVATRPAVAASEIGYGEDHRKNIPIKSTVDGNEITNETLPIVSRNTWGARTALPNVVKLNLPVHRVIIHHTATDFCESQRVCIFRTRLVQNFHIDSFKFADIGYNFLVGGDGRVYEGRGWDDQGAHKLGYNVDSIGVALIGTFTTQAPTAAQLAATQKLIEQGVQLGKLVADYKLYGARQLGGGTESPGEALYKIITQWRHWSATVV